MRGDGRIACGQPITADFNSRPYVRGDGGQAKEVNRVQIFQFTPLREGRLAGPTAWRSRPIFQFTPLREGRQNEIVEDEAPEVISIHAPT